jgi:predicted ribosome quality control (RQC) complex YloA/Tae2 family protein
MAGPDEKAGSERIVLPDLFGSGGDVEIALDPALTRYENAARLYDKARRSRRAREEAESRLKAAAEETRTSQRLLQELRLVTDRDELREFRNRHAGRLEPFEAGSTAPDPGVPFRRYVLEAGYEVWVGRNAKQNDRLTFGAARKYDFWLHARGVGGSHVLLRRPRRSEVPPRHLIERAAAIAAFHSKARGSALVPVIVVERKFVRKAKGGAAGAVIVDREDVVIVEPSVPSE